MTAKFAQKIKVFKSIYVLYHITVKKSILSSHNIYIYSIRSQHLNYTPKLNKSEVYNVHIKQKTLP